jgi:hypothetical protein
MNREKLFAFIFVLVILVGPMAHADSKKSSPKLYEHAAKGTHIPEVTIEMRKAQQTNKPLTTTVNPALQGNALQKSRGVDSPVKPGYDLKANKGR